MANKNYKRVHTILFAIQMLLILVFLAWSIHLFVTNIGRFRDDDPMNDKATYVMNILMFLSFAVYAIIGYKKSPVFFNTCIAITFLNFYTSAVRAVTDLGTNEFSFISVVFISAVMTLLIIYALTYKKYDKFASVIGILMIVVELAHSIHLCYSVSNLFSSDLILSIQPFARLLGVSTLVFIHEVRNHWRRHEKAVESFENGESIGVND